MSAPPSTASLELQRPRHLRDALKMLRDEGPLMPIAGCTDVFVGLHFGTEPARRFLDLWGLAELRGIAIAEGRLRIGALTTFTELIRSPLVRRRWPILAAAAREVGGTQIQHRGTIGGNIVTGSPAGDTLPVLSVADSVVVLASARDERRVPFAAFYTGYRQTVRAADELVVAVELPRVDGRQWWRKVGTRAAQAISKVMMAAVRGDGVRIALGSVGPTIVRPGRTEALLARGGSIARAQAMLSREIHPIDDLRSTAEYRLRVSQQLLARFWSETA